MKRSNRRGCTLLGAVVAFTLVGAMTHLTPTATADSPEHTQESFSPWANYTSKWTRADAQQIAYQSSNNNSPGQNSLPEHLTMPDIPKDFPIMIDQKTGKQVWVWDTWPLTDARGNQYSYQGWNIIFSLTADPYAGYTFDDRHVNARISFWYRKATDDKGPWQYGGHVFGSQTPKTEAEWSGSARVFDGGQVKLFYTHLNFTDRNKPIADIAMSTGQLQANSSGVYLTGFKGHKKLLAPDGEWYQTNEQNPFFSFRDPFTFTDPAHPGETFMVFEGNTAGNRGAYQCKAADLGNSGEDPAAVTRSGANYQMANIGLARATKKDLTAWEFLPPILSGNCVNDQTERPQFVIKKVDGQWKYYLFTISHAFTYAAGLRGPDGVYGFVGDGIRSDFQPLNGSGLALGNPTDMNLSPTDPQQNQRQYQAYSHYVMPGGLVESFIDNVDGRRGGTLAPTVKVDFGTSAQDDPAVSTVDRSVGTKGLLDYGYIPANIDMVQGKSGSTTLVQKKITEKQYRLIKK